MKIVRDFFVEKHYGYRLVIQANYEDEDNEYYDLDFYIKNDKIHYYGFANEEDRRYINYIIGGVGLCIVLDYDIDKESKTIFIYFEGDYVPIERYKKYRGGWLWKRRYTIHDEL